MSLPGPVKGPDLVPVDVTGQPSRIPKATHGIWEDNKLHVSDQPKEKTRAWEDSNISVISQQVPLFDREASAMEERTPRYRGGTYLSYEEMLDNMDEADPFSGQVPPPCEKSQTSLSLKKPPRPAHPVMKSALPPRNPSARSRKQRMPQAVRADCETRDAPATKRRKSSQVSSNGMNATYTLHDSMGEHTGSLRKRPNSARSTGTYVIEPTRHDSQADLIPLAQPAAVKLHHKIKSKLKNRTWHVDHRSRRQSIATVLGPNEAKIRKYIKENISHRECKKYVPDAKKEDGRCQCGQTKEWHVERKVDVDGQFPASYEWKPDDEHTEAVEPNTFGTIHFHGFGQESTRAAPYIRVDSRTPPGTVWNLLSDHWRMPNPKLIISVTGGAKRFFLKNRLKSTFKRGLINAAKSTGAWIVTGGTSAGVMEFVGEAARDHAMGQSSSDQQVVALGIATWGIVDNKDSLTSEDGEGLFPATYSIDDLSDKDARGLAALDYNHTHFILVDNGTEKKFGKEIEFRAALEHYIQDFLVTGIGRNQSVHIPVVLLVLEGGENTLHTAAMEVKRNIPVVVIQGSGRAADYIDAAYRLTKGADEDKTYFPKNFDQDMKTLCEIAFDWSGYKDPRGREKRILRAVENMRTLLSNRRLVTVYRQDEIDTTNEIDQAILFALLKANQSDAETQLNLALAWNRCDVARAEIFTVANRGAWQNMDLYSPMFTALVQDRVDFVKLFLDNGVSLKKFLTVRRLRDLYYDVINDRYAGNSANLLRNLLQIVMNTWGPIICCRRGKIRENRTHLLYAVGQLITRLLRDQHQNLYCEECFEVPTQHNEVEHHTTTTLTTHTGHKCNHHFKPDFEDPERQLFLWAVLLNRRQLVHLFWTHGQDHIGGALYGSALLKSLAAEASRAEEIDLSADILEHCRELQAYAVGVLNECYQHDKTIAHQLLVRVVDTWGNTTVLELAESAQQMDFVNHSSCQTILNRIWKGKMALYTATWKILCSLFIPFTLPLIKFTPYSDNHHDHDHHHHKEGDDYGNNVNADIHSEQEFQLKKETQDDAADDGDGHEGECHHDHTGVEFVQSTSCKHQNKQSSNLLKVGLCGNLHKERIGFFRALHYYHTAPVTKFFIHTLSYLTFLGLFSYFVMIDLHEGPPTALEIIIWGWVATLIVEEIRQIMALSPRSIINKLRIYFRSVWNCFDVLVHSLLLLCILLRFSLDDLDFHYARMAYAGTVALYYLRFLHNFFVEKNIGPKVIMIRKMMTDLVFFMAILLVVILAYGVATQTLRYPNAKPDWIIFKHIFYKSYWQMYGELFLEELEGEENDHCSTNRTIYRNDPNISRCPQESWLVLILLACYMILTNVLLLNILIAMFSYTFQQVQDNSEKVWRFYRYSLIYEFFDRPTMPPPFIIFNHVYRVVRYTYRHYIIKKIPSHDFCQLLPPELNKRMTAFERAGMENYLIKQERLSAEHIDVRVQTTGEKIEQVINDLEHIKEQMAPQESDNFNTMSLTQRQSSPPVMSSLEAPGDVGKLQSRINTIEQQMRDQGNQMGQILSMLNILVDHQAAAAAQRQETSPGGRSPQQQAWASSSDLGAPSPRQPKT